MSEHEQSVDVREVVAEMSERGRLEWDLAVERWQNKQLRRRLAEMENAQQTGPRGADKPGYEQFYDDIGAKPATVSNANGTAVEVPGG